MILLSPLPECWDYRCTPILRHKPEMFHYGNTLREHLLEINPRAFTLSCVPTFFFIYLFWLTVLLYSSGWPKCLDEIISVCHHAQLCSLFLSFLFWGASHWVAKLLKLGSTFAPPASVSQSAGTVSVQDHIWLWQDFLKRFSKSNMVAHGCNPSTWKPEAGG